MDKLQNIINTVLTNRNKEPVSGIDEDSHLRNDIGMDSLDLAELTVRIEAEYGVDVFEDSIVNTVGEIKEKIEQN